MLLSLNNYCCSPRPRRSDPSRRFCAECSFRLSKTMARGLGPFVVVPVFAPLSHETAALPTQFPTPNTFNFYFSKTSQAKSLFLAPTSATWHFPLAPFLMTSHAIAQFLYRISAPLFVALSTGCLGPSWGLLGAVLGHLGGRLGSILGHLGAFLGPLAPSWGLLGAILGHLGPIALGNLPLLIPKIMGANPNSKTGFLELMCFFVSHRGGDHNRASKNLGGGEAPEIAKMKGANSNSKTGLLDLMWGFVLSHTWPPWPP